MFVSFAFIGAVNGQNLVVKASETIAEIQPTMYGIFFEDINFAADGGIYAEMIKNRSFEFYKPLMGWSEVRKSEADGHLLIQNREDLQSANPRYASITVNDTGNPFGLANEGFRGMGIKQGLRYDFSVLARTQNGESIHATIQLLNAEGVSIGQGEINVSSNRWDKYSASLIATQTVSKGSFRILFKGSGTIDIDMVSLFPQDTWKNRPAGRLGSTFGRSKTRFYPVSGWLYC